MNIQGILPMITSPLLGTSAQAPKAAATSSTSGSSSSGSNSTSAASLQQTFLNLLVTELQNQDPTAPVDPTEMVGQLDAGKPGLRRVFHGRHSECRAGPSHIAVYGTACHAACDQRVRRHSIKSHFSSGGSLAAISNHERPNSRHEFADEFVWKHGGSGPEPNLLTNRR